MEQQDLFAALEARDEGLERVTENAGSWMSVAMGYLRQIPPDWEGNGEDLKIKVIHRGCPEPHHHNAWGALLRSARLKGYLVDTGRTSKGKTKSSHARDIKVCRRTWRS